jgi:hypothetical protein
MEAVQRSLLKNKRRYSSFLSYEYSVEDNQGSFVVEDEKFRWWLEGFIHLQYLKCVIQWEWYSSCVLIVLPGEEQLCE